MGNGALVSQGWEIRGIRSSQKFFAGLADLLPLPAVFYFEGQLTPRVRQFLAPHRVEPTFEIQVGTIWPKPFIMHVNATPEFAMALGKIASSHARTEICWHFHAYREAQGLVQWYDAFALPLLVSSLIPEEKIVNFSRRLKAEFSRIPE